VSAQVRLGVDVGTSNTVAMLDTGDGRARPLLFDASPLLPSAVWRGVGALLTGADAERAAVGHPSGFEANPKRRIDEGSVWLGEETVAVVDLIAAVLRRVLDEAVRVGGVAPAEVVVTHPAASSRPRLAVLTEAAARAGLGAVTCVPEPVAAAAERRHPAAATRQPQGGALKGHNGAVRAVARNPTRGSPCSAR
jgi:molecular chaperone DnaK (HSP70)